MRQVTPATRNHQVLVLSSYVNVSSAQNGFLSNLGSGEELTSKTIMAKKVKGGWKLTTLTGHNFLC